jgi:EAL domain-containing protein (putative c-di-GMP-specific phosphodiesterase class I)
MDAGTRGIRRLGRRRRSRADDFGSVQVVLQPIIEVATGTVVAAEALARFIGTPTPVEQIFAVAHASGRGAELEAACIRAALLRRPDLPPGVRLSVNVSPDALSHPAIAAAFAGDLDGIIVEITEHVSSDPSAVRSSLDWLRGRGAQVAVDDTGSGYAGLLRLAALDPDIVKLDRTLVAGLPDSLPQTAIVEALVTLSARLGWRMLGEGVESLRDLAALAEIGVDYAQGTIIAPAADPMVAVDPAAVEACRSARRRLLSGAPPYGHVDGGLDDDLPAARGGPPPAADLSALVRMAAESYNVDLVSVSLVEDGSRLHTVASTDPGAEDPAYWISEFPALRRALDSGALIEAHLADQDLHPAARHYLTAHGLDSLLIVPIVADGVAIGVLDLSQHNGRRWTAREITRARRLGEQLAQVVADRPAADDTTSDQAPVRRVR